MRRFLLLAALVVIGVATWRVGMMLSSDAIGMAVGMVFGALAGIPAALLVLATSRRSEPDDEERYGERARPDRQLPAYPYQPPVIVVTGAQAPQAQAPMPGGTAPYFVPPGGANGWGNNHWEAPQAQGGRRFKMVGEKEEWIE